MMKEMRTVKVAPMCGCGAEMIPAIYTTFYNQSGDLYDTQRPDYPVIDPTRLGGVEVLFICVNTGCQGSVNIVINHLPHLVLLKNKEYCYTSAVPWPTSASEGDMQHERKASMP